MIPLTGVTIDLENPEVTQMEIVSALGENTWHKKILFIDCVIHKLNK